VIVIFSDLDALARLGEDLGCVLGFYGVAAAKSARAPMKLLR
jgi:hypothetical protein